MKIGQMNALMLNNDFTVLSTEQQRNHLKCSKSSLQMYYLVIRYLRTHSVDISKYRNLLCNRYNLVQILERENIPLSSTS